MCGGPVPHKRVGQYELFNCIGQGSFASVFRGLHVGSRHVVAIKAVVRAHLNHKLQQNLETEVKILQSCQHPNIMRLYEVQTTERHVYLMLELCPGGDLMQVIKSRGPQTEAQARSYLSQLAHGLAHLRQRNLIHRDLKPQNLLLSSREEGAVLKIGDFGFARYMQERDMAETLCGSPLYMAPEILRFHKYDAKADLWSVGTIAFELVTGKPPFSGGNHIQLLRNIDSNPPVYPSCSSELLRLLQGLLQRDPKLRICFSDFFSHPFLSSVPDAGSKNAPLAADRCCMATPATLHTPAAFYSPPVWCEVPIAPAVDRHPAVCSAIGACIPAPVSSTPCGHGCGACSQGIGTEKAHGLQLDGYRHAQFLPNGHESGPLPDRGYQSRQTSTAGLVTGTPPYPARTGVMADRVYRLAQPPSSTPRCSWPLCGACDDWRGGVTSATQPWTGQPWTATRNSGTPNLAVAPSVPPTAAPPALLPSPFYGQFGGSLAPESERNFGQGGHDPSFGMASACPSLSSTFNEAAVLALTAECRVAGSAAAPSGTAAFVAGPGDVCDMAPVGSRRGRVCTHAPFDVEDYNDASLLGSDSDYVLVAREASSLKSNSCVLRLRDLALRAQQALTAGDDAADRAIAEVVGLLSRGGAIADLACVSVNEFVAGEVFSSVEALALHVKALDVISNGLVAVTNLSSASPPMPSRLAAAAAHAFSQADELRTRFGWLLKSADSVRRSFRSANSPCITHTTAREESATVCVEELLYRHALSIGREAAVDELLGNICSSAALYSRARLVLEHLAREPLVCDADRTVLTKYAAGFAWRLHESAPRFDYFQSTMITSNKCPCAPRS